MEDLKINYKLNPEKQYDIFFKKLYYVLLIVINNSGVELISIVNIISDILNLNKKTCYRYIKDLVDLEFVKQENVLGKRIITVDEISKQKLYNYLIPAFPLVYQDVFIEILTKKVRFIKFNKTEFTSSIVSYTEEIEELLIDILKRELPERFIPKNLPSIIKKELQNICKDKIQKNLLF